MYRPFLLEKKRHPYPGKKRLLDKAKPKFRQIDNPSERLKLIQRRILERILSKVELPSYMFGAVSGRTLVDHARQHLPNQESTVVRMDISSYYPNITCHHVYSVWKEVLGCPPPVAKLLTELTTFDWHLPQGAPTSPAIANILLASIYAPVCLASEKAGLTITTWVDDLIFSGTAARDVMETVRSTLAAHGFRAAPEKREILGPKSEKIITGARVGKRDVRIPHRKMAELRAAVHRLEIGAVPPSEMEHYLQNLAGRLTHARSVNQRDATKILKQMEGSVGAPVARKTVKLPPPAPK